MCRGPRLQRYRLLAELRVDLGSVVLNLHALAQAAHVLFDALLSHGLRELSPLLTLLRFKRRPDSFGSTIHSNDRQTFCGRYGTANLTPGMVNDAPTA